MGFVKPVLLEFRMSIQMTEELYNLSITSQMPKICMSRAYLFEATRYQANTNWVSNYNSPHRVDWLRLHIAMNLVYKIYEQLSNEYGVRKI